MQKTAHNQAQHYTAFGCRILASSHRCARRCVAMNRGFSLCAACLLAAIGATSYASESIESSCSDVPILIEEEKTIEFKSIDSPQVVETRNGFQIRVSVSKVEQIMEYRRAQLFFSGANPEGPTRFLQALNDLSVTDADLKLNDLVPSTSELRSLWKKHQESPDPYVHENYTSSEYYKASLHQHEQIPAIHYALRNGFAEVLDTDGSALERVSVIYYAGEDENGDEVQGLEYRAPDGRRIYGTCFVTPRPKPHNKSLNSDAGKAGAG